MPTRPLREDRPKMQRALDAWTAADHNYAAGANSLGMPEGTFRHQVNTALAEGLQPFVTPPKPRIRVPARSTYQAMPNAFGKAVRVFVWGCAHDSPNIPDKSRFRHAGMLAAELAPDFIVDLGDSLDLDSLSMHAPLGSVDDQQRPAFLTEIASVEEAYGEFHATAPPADEIPRYRLKGNHENRADRFEASNPTAAGVYTLPLSQVFARYGWSEKQYREWLFLEGVGFTHAPINSMGREYGGKTAENQIINETTFSVVWSHIHRGHFARRAKIGVGNGLQSYNTGTFMPQGLVKPYAGLSQTGWTYGVSELTLRDGQIESARNWSTLELSERFA
jgi:hypothetical protein